MTHVTSGKLGYYDYSDYYSHSSSYSIQQRFQQINISKDIIIKMLKRENELRLSSEIQRKYKNSKNKGFQGFVDVTEELQKQVVKEFRLKEDDGLWVKEIFILF